MGRTVISFIRNKTNFSSIIDKDTNIVKTIKYNNTDAIKFFDEIDKGLKKFLLKKIFHQLQKKFIKISNNFMKKEFIFDGDTDIIFNKQQNLFDLILENTKIDLTENNAFMEYFFDENLL